MQSFCTLIVFQVCARTCWCKCSNTVRQIASHKLCKSVQYYDLSAPYYLVKLTLSNRYRSTPLGNAGEAKATGQITWPTAGEGLSAFIDPRDVGAAAAHILLQVGELRFFFRDKGM